MTSTTAQQSNLPPRYSLPELALPAVLPTDAAALTALLHAVIAAHNDVKTQALSHMQHMMEQFILARHRMFGASSEQSPGQGRLFDAEALAADSDAALDVAPLPADTKADGKAGTRPARGKRGPLPAELKRVNVVHDVPESERTCPCGTPMVEIGEEVSEQLDLVPMHVRVLRHIRKRYGCPGSMHAPVTAVLPPQPLPKSNASADLLAMLLVVKFIDGLPLARFEYVLARHGVTVPRQTLARWVIGAAGVLQPLLNLMRDALLEGAFLHVDETVVQVLKESRQGADLEQLYVGANGRATGPAGGGVRLRCEPWRAGAGAPAARLPRVRDDRRLQRLQRADAHRRHRAIDLLGARASSLR